MESLQERFLRWVMGVSWSRPGYMLREEAGREKVVIRQRKRASNFEDKLRRGEGRKIVQVCLRKILGRERRGNVGYSKWEKEREETRVQNGMQREGREWREIEEEMKSRQGRERRRKVVESKYNSWYRVVKEEGKPEYLKKMKKESKWNRMVLRFRMGESVREFRY